MISCGDSSSTSNSSSPQSIDTSGYTLTTIAGSNLQLAEKTNADGYVIERGQFDNGVKTGTWVVYDPKKGFPTKLTSYANGEMNGPYMEYNDRGQINMLANYHNNKKHGLFVNYKYGRPLDETHYKDGKLHGLYRAYFNNSEKVQKEVEYKIGVIDGMFKQYTEDGKLVLEYVYKDGKVVSGGMVTNDNSKK